MNKKGAAHFEMVMAFLFFVGFMLFLFTIIKPYDEDLLSNSVIDGIFNSFREKVETPYTKVFIKADSPTANCFYVDFNESYFRYPLEKSAVYDVDLDEVDSEVSDNAVVHLADNRSYFYVGFSEGFEQDLVSCSTAATDFKMGSIMEKEIFSLKNVFQTETEYSQDYDGLKTVLGVPPIYDFTIISPNLEVEMERLVPDTGDVLAKDFVVDVLNESNGKIINAKFTLKIW